MADNSPWVFSFLSAAAAATLTSDAQADSWGKEMEVEQMDSVLKPGGPAAGAYVDKRGG